MHRGAYVFGIYPRSEELIELSRKDTTAFKHAAESEARKLYEKQLKLGMSYAADPELVWDDMFRPIALSAKGIRVNGLNRFFETNTFYKVPVLEAYPQLDERPLTEYLAYRGLNRSLLTFPDPFTMYCLSKSGYSGRDTLRSFGALLASAAKAAREAGYEALALKGPSYSFCRVGELYGDVLEAISSIRRAFNGKVFLQIYFGWPLKENLEFLKNVEVDSLGVDPRLSSSTIDGHFKAVSLGLIDGLNTKMEEPSKVLDEVDRLANSWGVSEAFLTNNVDLEFLPEKYAEAKLNVIGEVIKGWSI